MSYQVKQGNIFGRIGSGIGRGLAEQLPKEIERGRMAEGLRQFEQESANLTPMQQLARLSAIPGITPQQIQSFGELAKQQQARNAYQKFARGEEGQAPQPIGRPGAPSAREEFQRNAANINFAGIQPGKAASPTNAPSAQGGEQPYGVTPEINPTNPLNPKYEEIPPFSEEERNARIAEKLQMGLAQTPAEAAQLVSVDEAAERGAPTTAKENQKYLNQVREDTRNELKRQLQIGTQKEGQNIYKDLTGETLLNIENNVEEDLRRNPNASMKDVVTKWLKKGLDFAKTKPLVDTLASRDSIDFIFKHGQTLQKLKSHQQIYADMNAEEEFYNKLKAKNTPGIPGTDTTPAVPEVRGFSMSPQGAAQIAFPLSKSANQVVNQYSAKKGDNPSKNAYAIAAKVSDAITDKDSLLAIAKALRDKDPLFDQAAFFDYFQNNRTRLNPRQLRERGEGQSGWLPAWGDEWINFRR